MKGHLEGSQTPRLRSSLGTGVVIVALAALVAAAWRYPLVVAAACALAGILFMHELGHFVAARSVGMKVTEFYLGFGPRLWSVERGETAYGLRILPLGAYVRIIGMSRTDRVDPGDEDRAYRVKSYPRRMLVVSAGSLMHFALAIVAFLALHAWLGAPDYEGGRWQVAEIIALRDGVELPAAGAGIAVGDRIVAVDGVATLNWDDFVAKVQSHAGESVVLDIERDGALVVTGVTLATDPGSGGGLLGVRAERLIVYETVGLPTAVVRAVSDFGRSVWDSGYGIWSLFANLGSVADRIVSPPGDPSAGDDLRTRPLSVVGIVDLASDDALGWPERAALFALVNVFLGVFNLLPIPPFDGGHVAIATYERWRERAGRGRYLSDPRALDPVVAVVVTALMLLAVGLLYLDIANPVDL